MQVLLIYKASWNGLKYFVLTRQRPLFKKQQKKRQYLRRVLTYNYLWIMAYVVCRMAHITPTEAATKAIAAHGVLK